MTSSITHLPDQLFECLRDLHSVELEITRTLPLLARLATVPELRNLLSNHAVAAFRQESKLRAIFERHGETPGGEVRQSLRVLIENRKAHLAMAIESTLRDFMLLSLCARIKGYEIAAYRFTTALAQGIGYYREAEVVASICEEVLEMIHHLNSAAANLLAIKRTASAL